MVIEIYCLDNLFMESQLSAELMAMTDAIRRKHKIGVPRKKHEMAYSGGDRREFRVKAKLQANGWEIISAGWPDIIAVYKDSVRFIEVKRLSKRDGPTEIQKKVHRILFQLTGIRVEILRG